VNNKITALTIALLTINSILFTSCQKDDDWIENDVPVVNAGTNQDNIIGTVSELSGSAEDKDGQVVAYLWSQKSGPSESIIVNPGSVSTEVKNLISGTYIFQLMATDNKGATGVSTVTLKVAPITTLVLQPARNPDEYKLVLQNGNSVAQNGHLDMPIEAWTDAGSLTTRFVTKFNLSSIPANAKILSAKLYLYSYPSPTINGNLIDANYGTQNSFTVQRITAGWNPTTFNWNNQPSVSTSGQVVVPVTSESSKDLQLDVKDMVSSMVVDGNHGFYFKLENEVVYNCRIFVSSFTANYPEKHPKLEITYQ
jgi:hypothetical protein